MNWILKKFDELTLDELYAILQLRNAVFVVEQNCIYQDIDNIDKIAWHQMGWQENKLVAYTRLIPPGIVNKELTIGRVVTSLSIRKSGLGRELMQQSITSCEKLFGPVSITL